MKTQDGRAKRETIEFPRRRAFVGEMFVYTYNNLPLYPIKCNSYFGSYFSGITFLRTSPYPFYSICLLITQWCGGNHRHPIRHPAIHKDVPYRKPIGPRSGIVLHALFRNFASEKSLYVIVAVPDGGERMPGGREVRR